MTDPRLVAVKDRATAELSGIPGVTGVGIGVRERDGRRTGELVLKVAVRRKRPTEELTPGELIPPAFEGVGVDVFVLGAVPAQPLPPAPLPPGALDAVRRPAADQESQKVRQGGCCIQVDLIGAGLGTGGCFWTIGADTQTGYLLTNWHVLMAAEDLRRPTSDRGSAVLGKTRIGQADNSDGPSDCCDHIIGTVVAGDENEVRDEALIKLRPETKWLPEIKELGSVKGTHDIDPVHDLTRLPTPYPVRKYGQMTRRTGGFVDVVDFNPLVTDPNSKRSFRRGGIMVIRPNENKQAEIGTVFFADAGDSGSAIVNNANEVVGLHMGGAEADGLHVAYAFPIAGVIARFTADGFPIQIATAATEGDVRVVPGKRVRAPLTTGEAPVGAGSTHARTLSRVGADLAASAAGRRLRDLWTDHHTELLDLVQHRRRVTIAWHRGGGPALLHTLIRMAADPALAMPATVNGEPPLDRVTRIHAAFHANASPELRRALDRALTVLPDPAALTYDQLVAAIATR